MKNVLRVSILCCVIILIGCPAKNNFELLTPKANNSPISLIVKQINIPTDSIGMQYYRRISTYYNGSDYYYIGYHKILNALDIYNISAKEFVKRIKLEKSGPNRITSLNSIFIHNLDSIFINEYISLVIVDTTGKIKRRINLSEKSIFDNNKLPFGTLTSTLNFNIAYLNKNNTILLYYVPREFEYFSYKYLMSSFLGEMSLNTTTPKVTLLPVKYSSYYLNGEKNGFGNMFQPNVSIHKDLIIFNFPIESNIYTYNLYTGETHKYGAQSGFTKNLVEPYSKKFDENLHLIKNPVFFKTIYDPYKRLYYRIHWGNSEIKKNSIEFNTLYDKHLYLMVFDQDLNLLKEIELEDYKYLPFGYFFTNEGLFLSTGHPNNEELDNNKLQFDLFIFHYE